MVNSATLIGRVGKEVESAQANGKTVAKFSLATTESYKDKSGEKVENTTWHNICLLYTSPSPRDRQKSRMPSSA